VAVVLQRRSAAMSASLKLSPPPSRCVRSSIRIACLHQSRLRRQSFFEVDRPKQHGGADNDKAADYNRGGHLIHLLISRCLEQDLSESRYPLFGIMLYLLESKCRAYERQHVCGTAMPERSAWIGGHGTEP
jgi:hypothetical protein